MPPGAWMSVCCECCVLSGRGLCDRLITRPEEFCRLWCVWVWSRNIVNEEALAHWGLLRQKKENMYSVQFQLVLRIIWIVRYKPQ